MNTNSTANIPSAYHINDCIIILTETANSYNPFGPIDIFIINVINVTINNIPKNIPNPINKLSILGFINSKTATTANIAKAYQSNVFINSFTAIENPAISLLSILNLSISDTNTNKNKKDTNTTGINGIINTEAIPASITDANISLSEFITLSTCCIVSITFSSISFSVLILFITFISDGINFIATYKKGIVTAAKIANTPILTTFLNMFAKGVKTLSTSSNKCIV